MIDRAGELGVIFLDDKRQPLSQVRCGVCDQAISEALVQEVTNGDLGAIEMCGKPECLGYILFVQTKQGFALILGRTTLTLWPANKPCQLYAPVARKLLRLASTAANRVCTSPRCS